MASDYPILPLKNAVLFPSLFMPLSARRAISIAAVEAGLRSEEKTIVIVSQRDSSIEAPSEESLYKVGTRGVIKKMSRTDDRIDFIIQGIERVTLLKLEQTHPYLLGRFIPFPLLEGDKAKVEALRRSIVDLANQMIELSQPQSSVDLSRLVEREEQPIQLAYLLASFLNLDIEKEQQLLEVQSTVDVLQQLYVHLQQEVQILEIRQKITKDAQNEVSRQQRDYMLRQQLNAIQQELGETAPEKVELQELRKRLDQTDLPENVRKEAERDLGRLERLSPAAPDYQVIRSYLEFILDLPWRKWTSSTIDLSVAEKVLDEDHYDLEDTKNRILEHLAVLKLNPKARAPILSLIGPPGVGKTSLGQSIARALDRKFERMSLGGLHDEAELRGHRRTYIGAMPGRILQAIRRAGTSNPILMLDELDKIGHDFRGDPAAALLEILDPAQNNSFRDNYLDLPFDLSQVFFITTANTTDTIPGPLLDRIEILRLSGYTEEEKLQIAKRYLIPRRLSEAGLDSEKLNIPDDTLRHLITRYTRESGVRNLERAIGRVASKIARRFAEGTTDPVTVMPKDLLDLLGPESIRTEMARKNLPPGVATGLAWTPVGGEILYIEASLFPESDELRLTGQLGNVMRESAKAAQTYILSHLEQWGLKSAQFRNMGVHIHVPAGAIPKDGPSAGVAMVTALLSAFLESPSSNDIAMTGEITLSGLVLPVGGIKEKLLAARRAGIRRVILPRDNEQDLRDLPEPVRKEFEFILVERIEEAVTAAIPGLSTKTRPMAA